MRLKKYFFVSLALLLSASVFAQTSDKFINVQDIPNFEKTILTLKGQTQLPVIFPQKIPSLYTYNRSAYYIYAETKHEAHVSSYLISIDKTPKCHGKHNCMIGNLSASIGNIPQIYYSMDNQQITVAIELANGKKAYFTPSHAMADFWPSQMEWRDGNVLYRLSWNLAANSNEKEQMVAMVNSIVKY